MESGKECGWKGGRSRSREDDDGKKVKVGRQFVGILVLFPFIFITNVLHLFNLFSLVCSLIFFAFSVSFN